MTTHEIKSKNIEDVETPNVNNDTETVNADNYTERVTVNNNTETIIPFFLTPNFSRLKSDILPMSYRVSRFREKTVIIH